MMVRKLFLFLFAAALLTAFGCSSGGDVSVSPTFACTDSGTPGANAVTMTCGGSTYATQQVDVVIGGPATLRGLTFSVMYDADNLVYDSYDASAASQLFPGALILVTESPSSVTGYKDVVVGIQATGGTALTDAAGQHLVLRLTFKRAPGTTFASTPVVFDSGESLEATPSTAGTTFASNLAVTYQ